MKKSMILVVISLVLSCSVTAFAIEADSKAPAGMLTIIVDNFKNDSGLAQVWLFKVTEDNREKSLKKVTPFKTQSERIVKNRIEVTFEDLPFGDYGVMVLHDVNMDGKPAHFPASERMGFSNGYKKKMFSAPKLGDLAFSLKDEKLSFTLSLK